MPHLSLRLLGGFQAHLDDQPLTGFVSDKVRGLLIYLVLEAARAHSRSQLAGLFWPDWPELQARTYLRHALTNLRQILHDKEVATPFLLVTRSTLQFNLAAHHTVDVLALDKHVSTPHKRLDGAQASCLATALTAYVAPLLSGFYMNGCPAFEAWLLLRREHLQRQVLDALQALAAYYEGEGAYHQAIRFAQRMVTLEPWREEAHRQLMRLLAHSGQRSAALMQYERCVALLRDELGVEPGDETVALYAAIRAGQLDKVTELSAHSVILSPPHPVTVSPKHNLPAPTTPLLGRRQDLAAVQALLLHADIRLVTLTGPGGVGKTRLGLAVAGQLLEAFPDGIFVTFLAAMREPALVLSAIAQTLAVGETGNQPLNERLITALRERALLLVIDNFEHVVAAASVIAELLAACPRLKVLVTSRERLRLQGEHEYSTPPLPMPSLTAAPTLATLGEWPAVELFCQRAMAARHDFVLTSENATAIAAICTRLDGLPLAIELAAVRSKLFAPQALLERLTHRNGSSPLQFLKADIRNVPDRHRSLWQTIAWSYALLDPAEQRLFRCLAIFVGDCTPAAVTAVCYDTSNDLLDPLDGLTALVDKHLLQVAPTDREVRFTMLETVREFGLAQLAACQELATVQQRHATYFTHLVAVQSPRLVGAESAAAAQELQAAYSNVRAAFQWLLAQQDVALCLHLCDQLLEFWVVPESFKEAEMYLQATLQLAAGSPPSPAYVNALASAGFVAFLRGQSDLAQIHFTRCLAMNAAIDNLGSPKKIGVAYGLLAWLCFDQGDYATAHRHFAAAQANDIATGDEWALAMTLTNRGKMAAYLGDFAQAEALLEDALLRHRRIGQAWGIAGVLTRQGLLYILQRKFTEAERVLAESQAIAIEKNLVKPNFYLGLIALETGAYAEASALLQEALHHEQAKGAPRYLLPMLEAVARLAVKQGDYWAALTLAGAICASRRQLNLVMPPVEKQLFEEAVVMARGQLRETSAVAAWAEGEAMTLDEAGAYALGEVA